MNVKELKRERAALAKKYMRLTRIGAEAKGAYDKLVMIDRAINSLGG